MFNRELRERIKDLEGELNTQINNLKETHKVCKKCNKVGHKVDMKKVCARDNQYPMPYAFFSLRIEPLDYYHPDCYAEEFNQHLCPCGCGKWIDNKKEK